MALLRNKSHQPQQLYWKPSGGQLTVWWTEAKSYEAFYGEVVTACQRNGWPVPSDADVQNYICQQLPRSWCTEEPGRAMAAGQPGQQGCSHCQGR